MLALMEKQQDRAMIPRSLPFDRDKIVVANKTGWDEEKLARPLGRQGRRPDRRRLRQEPEGALRHRDLRAATSGTRVPARTTPALVTGAAMSRLVYDYFNGAR